MASPMQASRQACMIISHARQFVLYHNPKTGGMSLRSNLLRYHDDPRPSFGIVETPWFDYPLDFAHLRLHEIQTLFPALVGSLRNYRSLIVVRNPYRRFISAVDQHVKTLYPDFPWHSAPPSQRVSAIEGFIDNIRLDLVRTDYRFVHLSPQVWFLRCDGFRLPATVIPFDRNSLFIDRCFDSLGLPREAVTHENRSRLDLNDVLSSRKITSFVEDFYSEDFAFLAADPSLDHLAKKHSEDDRSILGYERSKAAASGMPSRHPDTIVPNADSEASLSLRVADVSTDVLISPAALQPMTFAATLAAATSDIASGKISHALEAINIVLQNHPDHPRALGLFGQIAVTTNKPAVALAPLQRAVALDPRLEHRIWLALCLAKLGVRDDALRVMADATKAMPPTANAHYAAGMVYFALGQHDDAAHHYGECIARDSARASAHYRYARSLQATGQLESSVEAYRKAIHHASPDADHYADLSGALSELGRFEEARAAGETAVSLDPTCIIGHNNLGHALLCLNRSAAAAKAYENAIEMDPAYAKAQFGHATALLKSGDFTPGWRQYEWRWRDCQRPRQDLAVPLWQGEDIHGATILLHAEQGFGDTLQFVRFAPSVAARGGRVVLEVPSQLARLLRDVDGVAEVVAQGDPLPPIQWHCPMASLPLALDLRLETVPGAQYLHRPASRSPRMNFVVGLVWAGDPRPSRPSANRVDQRRSTNLDVLAPLLEIPGIQFASFQLGPARAQLAASGLPVTDMMTDVTDFADTAMRLAGVDLLISVDTAIVHLAGAMGMPVWMLSRFDGCWRWLEFARRHAVVSLNAHLPSARPRRLDQPDRRRRRSPPATD